MRKSITKRGILIGAVNHYDKMSFERPVGQLFGQIIVKGLIYTSQKERMGGWCWGVVSMTERGLGGIMRSFLIKKEEYLGDSPVIDG